MKKEILNELSNYLNRLEEVENDDTFGVFRDAYEDNIRELITEISMTFLDQIPEIRKSVSLKPNTLDKDLAITKGLIKGYLINHADTAKSKMDNQTRKFWTRFNTFFEKELPNKGYLKSEFVRYDSIEGKYLYIYYDYEYKLNYGIEYKECVSIDDIKMFIELAYSNWIKIDKKYDFTKEVNKIFGDFRLPYRLQKGKVIKFEYRTTIKNEKIIDYKMFERKIQYAEEMILSSESSDKKCALDCIIDSLQYMISIQQGIKTNHKYSSAAKNISNDVNSKIYSVVKTEIEKLMKISNEYFDIRHHEYLNHSHQKREAIIDPVFIEYLYNRAYALLYILKLKYTSRKN